MIRSDFTLRALVGAMMAGGMMGAVQAQTSGEAAANEAAERGKLETVTVTATRRAEPAQKVAIPLSVIDASTLNEGRYQSLDSLMTLVPNATLPDSTGVGTNKDIVIRGVSNPDPGSAVEPGFGIFRDGNYYGGTVVNFGSSVDLQRVEVLRGPQGGLYGRNAVGGALNLNYNRPKFQQEFKLDVLAGEYGTREADFVANLPLTTDTLALRLVGWDKSRKGGEIRNSYLNENIDNTKDRGARVGLRWVPNEKLQFDWTAESQETQTPERADFFVGPYTISNLLNTPLGTFNETEKTINRDTLSRLNNKFDYFAQEVSYFTDDIGSFTLATTLRKYKQSGTSDQDFSSIDPLASPGFGKQDLNRLTKTENRFVELRWVSPEGRPLTGVAGISYYSEDLTSRRSVDVNVSSLALGAPPPASLVPGAVSFNGDVETTSWSAFGEANYKFTDRITGTGSLRYTQDKKTLNYNQGSDPSLPLNALLGPAFPTYTANESKSFKNWSPGLGVSFQADPNRLFFARINTGFRSGGYNLTAPAGALAFNPEKATNVEVGAKTDWFDNRLRVNATLFQTRQKDKLINQTEFAGTTLAYLTNAGKARTNGFEIEASAQVTKRLTLSAAVGLLDSEILSGQSTVFGTTTDLAGKRPAYAATSTSSVSASYRMPLTERYDLTFFGSYRERKGGFNDNANTVRQDDYGIFDASIGFSAKTWSIALVARNLTDKRYTTNIVTIPGTGELRALSPGRWLGVRGTVEF